jgi:hypothetical protein
VATQVWTSTVGGRAHRVEADEGFTRQLRWYVDDELVAEKRSTSEKVRLDGPAGRVEVRFSTLGAPRRATVHSGSAAFGEQGLDLAPEPGSKAARREEAVRAHPERYALTQTVGGVAKVVVPIVLTVLFARFAFSLPLPRPDLPSLPRPDLPSLPLPDLPDWSAPGWVEAVLNVAHYVWPVVLAYVIARGEIKRRRRQDERREQGS